MKKIAAVLCSLLCAALALFAFAACSNDEPQEIKLSFDRQEAYFTGSTPLYPIAGETPTEGDTVESAVIVISSDISARMVLALEYDEGQQDIPGLVISVNGAPAADLRDGMTLYTSPQAETQANVSVQIYLENDSPTANAGKTLTFSFELSVME